MNSSVLLFSLVFILLRLSSTAICPFHQHLPFSVYQVLLYVPFLSIYTNFCLSSLVVFPIHQHLLKPRVYLVQFYVLFIGIYPALFIRSCCMSYSSVFTQTSGYLVLLYVIFISIYSNLCLSSPVGCPIHQYLPCSVYQVPFLNIYSHLFLSSPVCFMSYSLVFTLLYVLFISIYPALVRSCCMSSSS